MQPAPPVRIERCILAYTPVWTERWNGFRRGPLYVTFLNTGTKAIRRVRFRVVLPEHPAIGLTDTGRFTAGVPIAHVFGQLNAMLQPWQARPQPSCTAVFAEFADGTTWVPPSGR